MSNHHTQCAINLHHDQVNAGKLRRRQRQDERLAGYMGRWAEYRFQQDCALVFTFIVTSYMMIATAVYSGYVLS
jgi:hypothetical protein